MRTLTIKVDDNSLVGKRFVDFLSTLDFVSIASSRKKEKALECESEYTALDFLKEYSGAFKSLNDFDYDAAKYERLSEKYK